MACGDILRAELSHWLQQSLINEQAKQRRGLQICFGIQIIQGSQYLRRAKRVFVKCSLKEENIILKTSVGQICRY